MISSMLSVYVGCKERQVIRSNKDCICVNRIDTRRVRAEPQEQAEDCKILRHEVICASHAWLT